MANRDELYPNTPAMGPGAGPHHPPRPKYYGPAQSAGFGPQGSGVPSGVGQPPMYFAGPYVPPQKPRRGMWIAIGVLATITVIVVATLVFLLLNDEGTETVRGADDGASVSRGDGAPTKEDVRMGLEEFMTEGFLESGTSPEELSATIPGGINFDAFYNCIVDDIYDELTVDTLTAIALNDHAAPVPDQDAIVLERAGDECFQSIFD